jgi:hypothetical protein
MFFNLIDYGKYSQIKHVFKQLTKPYNTFALHSFCMGEPSSSRKFLQMYTISLMLCLNKERDTYFCCQPVLLAALKPA